MVCCEAGGLQDSGQQTLLRGQWVGGELTQQGVLQVPYRSEFEGAHCLLLCVAHQLLLTAYPARHQHTIGSPFINWPVPCHVPGKGLRAVQVGCVEQPGIEQPGEQPLCATCIN